MNKGLSTFNWTKFTFEFLSIFIAVLAAFGLNNWNEQRRDTISEQKILKEVSNGLSLDLEDVAVNMKGHYLGMRACSYFRRLINNEHIDQDSLGLYYTVLVRDFTSIMNTSGYEALKSKGLEIVKSDAIRFKIISLYDYHYQVIYKLEEGATEMQSFENFFAPIDSLLSDYMIFDEQGKLNGIQQPMRLSNNEKSELYSYLWRIENNRSYKIRKYRTLQKQITDLQVMIEKAY